MFGKSFDGDWWEWSNLLMVRMIKCWRVVARNEKMKATHLFKHPLRVRDASGLLPPLPSAEKNFRYAHSVFLHIWAPLFSHLLPTVPRVQQRRKKLRYSAFSLLPSWHPVFLQEGFNSSSAHFTFKMHFRLYSFWDTYVTPSKIEKSLYPGLQLANE